MATLMWANKRVESWFDADLLGVALSTIAIGTIVAFLIDVGDTRALRRDRHVRVARGSRDRFHRWPRGTATKWIRPCHGRRRGVAATLAVGLGRLRKSDDCVIGRGVGPPGDIPSLGGPILCSAE